MVNYPSVILERRKRGRKGLRVMDVRNEVVYEEAPYADTYSDRYGVLVGALETIGDIGRRIEWTHPSPDNIDGTTWLLRVYDKDWNLLGQSGEEANFTEAILSVVEALSPFSRPDEVAR